MVGPLGLDFLKGPLVEATVIRGDGPNQNARPNAAHGEKVDQRAERDHSKFSNGRYQDCVSF